MKPFAPRIMLLCVACLLGGLRQAVPAPERIELSLAGEWRARLDPRDEGLAGHWEQSALSGGEAILLPNTTDRAGLGFALDTNTMLHGQEYPVTTRFPGVQEPKRADEHGYLARRFLFTGPAWYERELAIPAAWDGRPGTLTIERAMWKTEAWLDGQALGSCDSLVAPHRYELGKLTPGKHRLTVRVDNRMIHNLSTITHAYGPETQTRWNGMVGKIILETRQAVDLKSVAVHPAADRRSARAMITLVNDSDQAVAVRLRCRLLPERGGEALAETVSALNVAPGSAVTEASLSWREPALPWDEFQRNRYQLEVALERDGSEPVKQTAAFGFRQIERADKTLRVNGRRLFLRGTLDCCVYPKTGHPPMALEEWEGILGVIRENGFNHVRFHTWCPPEAAFEAADRLGLYLQPEAPAWVDDWTAGTVTKPAGIGRDPQVFSYLKSELRRMLEAYGNHPSFVLLTIGNEFGERSTDWAAVNALVTELKTADPRRLYSGCTARRHLAADDFWITHDSGAPTRGVGPANTAWDFGQAAAVSPAPVIAHETGQRPVFPDYARLLPKFTGPLLPLNLERHRRGLAGSGLEEQVPDFARASARFQLAQYKAEHEGMLRTRDYSGYQLLMLNDFTGQSEALVGILDPFWETKGVVTAEEVRSWNAPTVLLARFAKYVWFSDEVFEAEVRVAHYGRNAITADSLEWALETGTGKALAKGRVDDLTVPADGLSDALTTIRAPLDSLREPAALVLRTRLAGAENRWNLWVYPRHPVEPEPAGVLVSRTLDTPALEALRAGGKVLLLAHALRNLHAARTGFESVYWSAGWWGNRFSSLGILCDPEHPALAEFPTREHCDWQWRDLRAGATTFHLEDAPRGFRPVIQAIPDFHFNSLLAQVFEARVGAGSLLVCGFDLENALDSRPAALQFRRSLFRYVASQAFRPSQALPASWVERNLAPGGLARLGVKVLKVDSEDSANGNGAANAIDGDPGTFWHTRWQPAPDPMPHELVLDLGREMALKGLVYVPRRDQANGRVAKAGVYGGSEPTNWGAPLATADWADGTEPRRIQFARPANARYLRLLIESEVNGNPFASVAEIDLIR